MSMDTLMNIDTTEATTPTERRWTWAQLIKVEPDLDDLYRLVPRTVRMYLLPGRYDLHDVVGFVERFTKAWYEARNLYEITHAIDANLDYLVGWHCHRPELKTPHAFDVARRHIHTLLDAEELRVKADVDAWLARRPPAEDGPVWQAWLLDRPSFDPDAAYPVPA